jgi:disulfide bond formation protein DsbB
MKNFLLALGVLAGMTLSGLAGMTLSGCGNQSTPTTEASAPPPTTPTPAAVAPGAGDPVLGLKVYEGTCVACHGTAGVGIMNLGKPLANSPMLNLSDKELVAFIVKGRDGSDKENTTGTAMPPKGGNPALTEKDLLNVVAYMRSLK